MRGGRRSAEDTISDHGPVEAAYLAALAAFAGSSGIDRLEIRDPFVTGHVHFGVELPVAGHGVAGLFPPDRTGYHDGAEVSLPVALELVRAMLRSQGSGWRPVTCSPCTSGGGNTCTWAATGRARTPWRVPGLSPGPLTASPYAAPEFDEAEVAEPADEHFWTCVHTALASRHALLIEESYVRNAARWHRITPENLDTARAGLSPRA